MCLNYSHFNSSGVSSFAKMWKGSIFMMRLPAKFTYCADILDFFTNIRVPTDFFFFQERPAACRNATAAVVAKCVICIPNFKHTWQQCLKDLLRSAHSKYLFMSCKGVYACLVLAFDRIHWTLLKAALKMLTLKIKVDGLIEHSSIVHKLLTFTHLTGG